MTDLLTLLPHIERCTPFAICMIATVTIAHLSACKLVLRGRQLDIARERIRVAIGALETMGQVWPRAKKVSREVKIIARELLFAVPEKAVGPGKEYQDVAVGPVVCLRSDESVSESEYFLGIDFTQYLDLAAGEVSF